MRFRRIQPSPSHAHNTYRAGVPPVTQRLLDVAELAGVPIYDSVEEGDLAGFIPPTAGEPRPERRLLPRGMP